MIHRCELRLLVDPGHGAINGHAELTFSSGPACPQPLRLYLHQDYSVESMTTIRGTPLNFEFDLAGEPPLPFLSHLRPLDIDVRVEAEELERGLLIHFGGVLPNGRFPTLHMSEEWMELGPSTGWYPFSWEFAPARWTARVTVPPGFQLLTANSLPDRSQNVWRADASGGSREPVIIGAREAHTTIQDSGIGEVQVHHIGRPTQLERIRKVEAEIENILHHYAHWFGSLRGGPVHVLLLPRKDWGAYVNGRMVVFAGEDLLTREPVSRFRWLGHELGHLWWQLVGERTWETWLNEGFAVYSGLMATPQCLGQARFDEVMEQKYEAIKDTPPILGFNSMDPTDPEYFRVLYDKGVVFLHKLEGEMGHELFLSFLRRTIEEGVAKTEHLLRVLGAIAGEELAGKLDSWLRTL